GRLFVGEGIAHDQVRALLGIFAQHAREVRRLHALGPLIVDAEFVLRLQERHVDLVDPGLLDRRAEDRGDLQLVGRKGGAAARKGERAYAGKPNDRAPAERKLQRIWQ